MFKTIGDYFFSQKKINPAGPAHANDNEAGDETPRNSLQRQRAINQVMTTDGPQPSITVEVQPDGDCGFTATRGALLIAGNHDLALQVTRLGFINSVRRAILELRNGSSAETQGLLTQLLAAIYADAGIDSSISSDNMFDQWQKKFNTTSSWAADAHFAFMAFQHNIRFEFYVIDPEDNSHLILRGQGLDSCGVIGPAAESAAATVRLFHNSTRAINRNQVEQNNHFDLLFFNPDETLTRTINELGYIITPHAQTPIDTSALVINPNFRSSDEETSKIASVPLQFQFDISVTTYNLGNNNPYKDTIEEIKKIIFNNGGTFPDFVVINEQEAKPSVRLKESVAVRVLKRCIDNSDQPLYTMLHDDNVEALTKPLYPQNFLHRSQTSLTVAYKNSSFPRGQVRIRASGQCVTNTRDHKGGIYVILSVYEEVNIALICVHLDSFSLDRARQQAIDLIRTCTEYCNTAGIALDGFIIAGDFNTRLHPSTFAPIDRARNPKAIKRPDSLVKRSLSTSGAIKTTMDLFKNSAPELQDLTFFELPENTYCHSPKLKPNPKRGNLYDIGGLDHIAFQNCDPTLQVLNFSDSPTARVVRPNTQYQLGLENTASPPKEVSDHAAVVGRLRLTCPARQALFNYLTQHPTNHISTPAALEEMHAWLLNPDNLAERFHPALLRAYFDYVIEKSSPGYNISSHLLRFDCLKLDIIFIIENLHALKGTFIEKGALYIRLIFETCDTLISQDPQFMLEMYNHVLQADCGPSILKMGLLKPFREWLDQNNIPRTCYTLSGNQRNFTVTRLPFFNTQKDQPENRMELTEFQQFNLR